MKVKYLSVLTALLLLSSLPISAHVGVNADHSKIKHLFLHLMGFDHLAFFIGLGLCVYIGGQLVLSMLARLNCKKMR